MTVYVNDFILLQIFYEGVACTIKSWDIIYRYGLECNYIYIVVLNIVNGNFGFVKSWQRNPRPIGVSVLLDHFGPTPSHTFKPKWKGPKGQPN